jgi:hypothetical protein
VDKFSEKEIQEMITLNELVEKEISSLKPWIPSLEKNLLLLSNVVLLMKEDVTLTGEFAQHIVWERLFS